MNKHKINNQLGVGMIEVLVAILILSTSLMALAAMQMRSLQYNQSAYFESQANILLNDIVDLMRINRDVVYKAAMEPYNLASTSVPATIAPSEARDIDQWRRLLASNLPDGQGAIDCAAALNAGEPITCTIRIQWNNINNVTGAGASDHLEDVSVLTYTAGI